MPRLKPGTRPFRQKMVELSDDDIEGRNAPGLYVPNSKAQRQTLVGRGGRNSYLLGTRASEQALAQALAQLFDLYVDSAAGSDSNDGTTESAPLATLSAAQTAATGIGDGVRIGLKAGSSWSGAGESLRLTSLDNGKIDVYGDIATNGAPEIDCSDEVSSWTKDSSFTNLYYADVTLPSNITTGLTYAIPFEDGSMLVRSSSKSDADATPFRYFNEYPDEVTANGDGTYTVRVWVHATASTDPGSNGSTYRVTTRETAIWVRDGWTIRGVHAKRNARDSGSIIGGSDILIDRCIMEWGNTHSGQFESGTVRDSIIINASYGGSSRETGASEMFVAFRNDASGLTIKFQNCGFIQEDGLWLSGEDRSENRGIFYHKDSGSDYSKAENEGCWFINLSAGITGRALDPISHKGIYARNCNKFTGQNAPSLSVEGLIAINDSGSTASIPIDIPNNGGDLTVTNSGFVNTLNRGQISSLQDLGDVAITQCTFDTPGVSFNAAGFDIAGNVGTINHSRNIIRAAQRMWTMDGDATTWLNDDNIYNNTEDFGQKWQINATDVTSLSDLQTQTGAEGNSVISAPNFQGNTATGDFRTSSADVDSRNAGMQRYYDLNQRQMVDGVLDGFPNVPTTVAEARTYVADPSAWTF